jgi:hypothetical protein
VLGGAEGTAEQNRLGRSVFARILKINPLSPEETKTSNNLGRTSKPV